MHSELQVLLTKFTSGKEVSHQDWKLFLQMRVKLGELADLNALTLLLTLSDHLQFLPEQAHPDIYLMLLRLSPEHCELIKKDLIATYSRQFDELYQANPNQPKTIKQLSAYITKIMLAHETLTVHRRSLSAEKELFVRCLNLASEQLTNGYLECCLGWMHYYGIGTRVNVSCAIICLTQAVEKQCAVASYYLAISFEESKEAKNGDRRVDCLLAAAKRGIPEAQFLYAENRYRRGLRLRNGDSEKAEKKFQEAVSYWEQAAHQGHPEAQSKLGSYYDNMPSGKKDQSKAIHWYIQAERQGELEAINRLAFFYANGLGVVQSVDHAIALYRRAIAQDDDNAIFSLMKLYLTTGKNEQNAIELFEALTRYNGHVAAEETLKQHAIKSNSGAALFAIGDLFERRKNVDPKDIIFKYRPNYRADKRAQDAWSEDQMLRWYREAVATGHAKAKNRLVAYYQKQNQALLEFAAQQQSNLPLAKNKDNSTDDHDTSTQGGQFSGELYRQSSEHQQKYNNENNDKLLILIERIFPDARSRPISICDLGCGHGVPTIDLLKKLIANDIWVDEMVGYDLSTSQIEQANKLKEQYLQEQATVTQGQSSKIPPPKLYFLQQNIESLPDKERFDVMFSWFTLHWMDDIEKARDSIFRALKPGGIIVYLNALEKPTLSALRAALMKTPKWSAKFFDYRLKPFITCNKSHEQGKQGYEDIFSEKFQMEPMFSTRGLGIRIFQTEKEFMNFLKSWIQELRITRDGKPVFNDEDQNAYVKDLVELLKQSRYDAAADVNYLFDGRIEFHEHYVFYGWHKPQLSKHQTNSSNMHLVFAEKKVAIADQDQAGTIKFTL